VVGTDAHSVVTDEMVAMHNEGIVTALISADEHSVSLSVAVEQIEAALEFLHSRLIQMETPS
jgi:hypothetical protein